MRQVYHHYTKWEDCRAGMFQPTQQGFKTAVALSLDLLADPSRFESAARAMVTAWPIAAEHNLTNLDQNRRSWVGQASCCYQHDARQDATKAAWWQLTLAQQDIANAVAERIIAEWVRSRSATLTLFDVQEGGRNA